MVPTPPAAVNAAAAPIQVGRLQPLARTRKATRAGLTTLRQVATRAKVSEMTVSRVMRGVQAVAPATRDHVLSVAAELGYVPNRIAGALASRSTNLLAIVVPSLTNHVYPEVLAGIMDVLADSQLQPVFGVTDYSPQREETLIHDMLSWRPGGLVVSGFNQTPRALALLRATRIPVVQVMDVDGDPVEFNVGISHHDAGGAMARHLLKRGYRNIAYIGSDLDNDSAARKRLESFQQVLVDARCPIANRLTPCAPGSISLGRELTEALLASTDSIDAIHYSNDNMAAGGLMHCLAGGVRVPTDVAVSGFAGLDIASALPIRLTTIRSPRREIGRRTAHYLLRHLGSDENRAINREVLPFELLPGDST